MGTSNSDDRLGTAEQAIEFAVEHIDDHFDRLQFLGDWRSGVVATSDEYEEYWQWLAPPSPQDTK